MFKFTDIFRVAAFLGLILNALPSIQTYAADDIDPAVMRNAVEDSVRAEGRNVGDFELTDQDGVRFHLSDYFREGGKPLVVSFIYTKCPHVCPTITEDLKRAVLEARSRYGDKFNALTVSFDPENDTPGKLKSYGLRFTKDFSYFRFATGSPSVIKALIKRFGFFYVKRDDGSFDHIDMVSVVRADGTVYRQVYSVRTQSGNIVVRLGELITGKSAAPGTKSLIDKLRFFCYKYDPVTNTYVIDYPILASIFIQSLVLGTIITLVWGKRIKGFFTRGRKGR